MYQIEFTDFVERAEYENGFILSGDLLAVGNQWQYQIMKEAEQRIEVESLLYLKWLDVRKNKAVVLTFDTFFHDRLNVTPANDLQDFNVGGFALLLNAKTNEVVYSGASAIVDTLFMYYTSQQQGDMGWQDYSPEWFNPSDYPTLEAGIEYKVYTQSGTNKE